MGNTSKIRVISGFMLIMLILVLFTGCEITFDNREGGSGIFGGTIMEKIEKIDVKTDSRVKLRIDNSSGEIIVKPWDGKTIHVTATKNVRARIDKKRLEKMLDGIRVIVEKNADSVNIRVEYMEVTWGVASQSVKLEIMVPEGMKEIKGAVASGKILFSDVKDLEKLDLSASSGSIDVIDSSAKNFDFNLTSGQLSAGDIKGDGRIKMTSGNMKLENINGSISYRATSGDSEIDGFEGVFSAEITSGSLDIKNACLKSGSQFHAISGNINAYVIRLDNTGDYRFDASSGDIRLYLPEDAGFNIDARTTSGSIKCDFAPGNQGTDGRDGSVIRGAVGKGGPNVDISVSSGNISIGRIR